MWTPVKGAELYETTAAQTDDVIHCNDTAPVCALSDLMCDTAYSVTVTPCSDLRGCNRTCKAHTHGTGTDGGHHNTQVQQSPFNTSLLHQRIDFCLSSCSSVCSRDPEYDADQQLHIQSPLHHPQQPQHKLHRQGHWALWHAHMPFEKQLLWTHAAALRFDLRGRCSGDYTCGEKSARVQ